MSVILKKHIEEIVSISDSEFEYVLSHFNKRNIKKHQFLVQKGGLIDEDYFVVKGLLKAFYTNDEGKERILQFAAENWWVSDYESYFKKERASIDIDCIEDSELLAISLKNRNKICEEFQKMERFFRIKSHFRICCLTTKNYFPIR